MGSGCSSSSSSSNILRRWPDTSVTYTGLAIPALGICNGDTLSEIEAVVLQKIIDFSTGIGILIPDIDLGTCALFTSDITCCNGSSTVPKELDDLMKIIFTALCTLYSDYTSLQTLVNALLNGPYDVGCLYPAIAKNSTLLVIIQQLIKDFCILQATVAALQTQVNTLSSGLTATIGNFLLNAIQSCVTGSVTKAGSGATATITFAGFAPIGSILMYGGSLSGKFDTSGLGLNPGPMCGWALCNGNNTTIDMRGYFPVGVNDGSMGSGAQNAEVDNAANPGQNYFIADHAGEIKHTLTSGECAIPAHSHTVSDPGHDHSIYFNQDSYASGAGTQGVNPIGSPTEHTASSGVGATGSGATIVTMNVGNKTTGITIGASSSVPGGAHENRPPYRALFFIQRVA